MNLIGKGTISAALFAATASVICAAPAQALNLKGGFTATDIIVKVTDAGSPDGNASFDFKPVGDPLVVGPIGLGFQTNSSGDFNDGNFSIGLLGPLNVAGGTLTPALNPFIVGIDTDTEGPVRFVLTSISDYVESLGATAGTKKFAFNLHGYFTNDTNDILGSGAFASTIQTANGLGSMTANLVTDVPTPAAVLPVLAGLLGMASKRKREEENA